MFDLIKKFFEPAASESAESAEDSEDGQQRILIAACALLLEVAHSDDEFSQLEQEKIVEILVQDFKLSKAYVSELMTIAEEERKKQIDLYYFAKRIRENYALPEKIAVIESVWKVIYADGKVDQYEEKMVRILSGLLGVRHQQMIDAKLRVAEGLKG